MNVEPSEDPPSNRLWRVLRAYLVKTDSLFGDPAAIAKRLWLSRAEHKLMASWIAMLEGPLRRLVYLMALMLDPPTPAPVIERKRRPRLGMQISAGALFDADDSEGWRVSFRLKTRVGRRCANAAAMPAAPISEPQSDQISSAPMAMRLEAVIRGYAHRDALAQKCAQHMGEAPEAPAALAEPLPKKLVVKPGWYLVAEAAALLGEALRAPRVIAPAPNSS